MISETRFDDLAGLEKNWDSFGSDPPSAVAIERARKFHRLLPADVVNPTGLGGVSMTYRHPRNKKIFVYHVFNDNEDVITYFQDLSGTRIEYIHQYDVLAKTIERFMYLNSFVS